MKTSLTVILAATLFIFHMPFAIAGGPKISIGAGTNRVFNSIKFYDDTIKGTYGFAVGVMVEAGHTAAIEFGVFAVEHKYDIKFGQSFPTIGDSYWATHISLGVRLHALKFFSIGFGVWLDQFNWMNQRIYDHGVYANARITIRTGMFGLFVEPRYNHGLKQPKTQELLALGGLTIGALK